MPYADPVYFIVLWIFMLVLCTVIALLEIQTEGGNGWAALLPSWRLNAPWIKWLLNGKELTGYHIYLSLHLILLFHFPVILFGWSPFLELTILSLYFSSIACEDFLWFVLNPHFGWIKFSGKNVSWFTRWWGPFPSDYYLWIGLSAGAATLRGTLVEAPSSVMFGTYSVALQNLIGWALGFGIFAIVAALLIVITAPSIRRFQASDKGNHPGHPEEHIRPAEMPSRALKSLVKKVKKVVKEK